AWPVLEWVNARLSKPKSANAWPSAAVRASCGLLFDRLEEPVVANGPRPFPEFPDPRLASLVIVANRRDDDELGLTDQVFLRHEADAGIEIAAVGRIVPIVAHH